MTSNFVACATRRMRLFFAKMCINLKDRHTENDFKIFKSYRDGKVFRFGAVPLKAVRNAAVLKFFSGGGSFLNFAGGPRKFEE